MYIYGKNKDNTKKNILFVLPFFPYPLLSGGHQAIFNGIRILKNQANVFILYEENWNEDYSIYYQQFINQIGFHIPIFKYKRINDSPIKKHYIKQIAKQIVNKIYRCLIKTSNEDPYYYIRNTPWNKVSYDRLQILNDIINTCKIDIVQCEMLDTIGYVFGIPSNIRKIFVHHEIGFIKERYYISSHCKDINLYKERLEKSKQYEIEALNFFDFVVTLSPDDKSKLLKAGLKTTIISSFCIINTIYPPTIDNYNPFSLVFIGSGNHPPNVDGLKWFIDNCWNKLRKNDSRYSLTIIGSWDNNSICHALSYNNISINRAKKKSKRNNITFCGFIPDIKKILNNSISVVPILYGSGIRMKIIESANASSPIVSTTVGAEGIPLEAFNGKNLCTCSCIISDDSDYFVKGIIALQNKELGKIIIRNAYNVVNSEFSEMKLRLNRTPLYS